MTFYGLIFYLTALVILAATSLAVTRRNPVHAVVYLAISFLGSAILFYQLGAPFLAAVEVIIYAGAIMVLFLFVLMMLRLEAAEGEGFSLRQWMPALLLGIIFVAVAGLMVFEDPGTHAYLEAAIAMPGRFGVWVFEHYWLSVEIISILLLVGLMAAVQVGRGKAEEWIQEPSEGESRDGAEGRRDIP